MAVSRGDRPVAPTEFRIPGEARNDAQTGFMNPYALTVVPPPVS